MTGVVGLEYNGDRYYYLKNIQEDVIGILNSNNERVVSYEYDSWGKVLSIKDSQGNEITDNNHIGIINPYRYRSYYYDTETKLYYLNSRYYNPEWKRFINADGMFGSNEDIISYNIYTYCSNNPIFNCDEEGEFALGLGLALKVVCAVVAAVILPKAVKKASKAIAGVAANVISTPKTSTKATTKSKTKTQTKVQSSSSSIPQSEKTIIYHTGNKTYKNLTPRPGKDTDGLSFVSNRPNEKYVATTVNMVNSTGVLEVIHNGPTHYAIRPVVALELEVWARTRETANENPHPYSILMMSIVWDSKSEKGTCYER